VLPDWRGTRWGNSTGKAGDRAPCETQASPAVRSQAPVVTAPLWRQIPNSPEPRLEKSAIARGPRHAWPGGAIPVGSVARRYHSCGAASDADFVTVIATIPPAARPPEPIGFGEFVVLAAAIMSTQALAVDAMLPALPTIVGALQVPDPNRGQWVVTAYIAGLGLGQLFWGILSDRFGRRPVLLTGLALYVLAALLCGLTGSFTALLGWRFTHGVAAASVVVTRSVIRDLYSGRHMARVMSLTFIVFLMVPVIAPSVGQLILLAGPWRWIFIVFGVFAAIVWMWALMRLRETLHPEFRLTLTPAQVGSALRLVLGDRTSIGYTLALSVLFGSLLSYVAMVQQIYDEVFHRASLMPALFALCAVAMGFASFLNSRIVERVGMRVISHTALLLFIGVALVHVGIVAADRETLWSFVVLQSATMACFSLAASNFGTMAMEPVGAIAGIGASVQGLVSMLGGALVGAAIGRQFQGTVMPLAVGAVICGLLSLVFVLLAEDGRLFRSHSVAATGAAGTASAGDR
jgi:DHA1 family bicyclomycin/chloramphenicol resistance-like MFS transporter